MKKILLPLLLMIPFDSFTQNTKKHTFQYNDTANKWKAGELSFEFNGQDYDAIVVNPARQKIRMHWLSKENIPYKNINAIKQFLQKKKEDVLMITNGGMYLKNNIPVGLFVSEGKELRPIDTMGNKDGNFYIQPNGVFFLDKTGSGYILTTNSFIDSANHKKFKINYATQSGPMLVVNRSINASFTPQSKNINLRSGVGILPNGYIVFVISRSDKTNFFDFASIFKNKFDCSNALYLDGAISKMYLKTLRQKDLGGDFGTMISVTNN
jgi:uncharacterized protein YigE (DUF2233 family)